MRWDLTAHPLSRRYMAQSKHAEARELMCSGALLFFSHGQVSHQRDWEQLGRGLEGSSGAPVSCLGVRSCFLGAGRSLFLTGSQIHRPASLPFENWQEPLFPLTNLSNALQQNSAADLSMLVLESLEKAEVEVANELLGEAA